ncbi:hypothetical protein G7Y89_g5161 [Cudoniella acicularis]|uniref:Uncharacterized protein n=1 Tax=Cudoniella acicularis TaxID=354080 RepID=A0A8H4RQ28_9HELO|nr:hypothetical protein G7Y89_g5161 [Cudoniella acicularis]
MTTPTKFFNMSQSFNGLQQYGYLNAVCGSVLRRLDQHSYLKFCADLPDLNPNRLITHAESDTIWFKIVLRKWIAWHGRPAARQSRDANVDRFKFKSLKDGLGQIWDEDISVYWREKDMEFP